MTSSQPILGIPLLPPSTPQETQPLVPAVAAASASTATNPLASIVNGLSAGASNLANLLPTGTFLAFTAIAPIITDSGTCDDPYELWLTIMVVFCFAFFCVFSSFTDSYQAADGNVYYGIVTYKGLWTPQLPVVLHPGDKAQYKLTWIDVIHALLSVAVFAVCALMTANIRACFYPNIVSTVVTVVPGVVGAVVSSLFVTFPSKRHGVGFPVTPAPSSSASDSSASDQKTSSV